MPREYGRWVRRDDYADYLESYLTDADVEVALNTAIERIDQDGDLWRLKNAGPDLLAEQVVVATGINRTQKLPDWPGSDRFTRELIHSGEYRNPKRYVGKHVLVVGVGNSGAEIATDLVEGGARRVSVAVRNPPIIVPRSFGPFVSLQHVLFVFAHLPVPVLDRSLLLTHRLFARNLTKHGLDAPNEGLEAKLKRKGGAPILDVGFLRQLRAGNLEIVPAVTRFDDDAVTCGHRTLSPDAVIAATGYHQDLEPLVGHLGVLNEGGLPTAHAPNPARPGLYFLGYELVIKGLLWNMARQAPRLAETASLFSSPRR
jgi:cation diffusion facilitator CzcD-associated flavoprotein CzcO